MELRNPFGIRDNQIVLIEDIDKSENGLRCNCFCPACKEQFEARMGDIRRHHFAHSGQGCDEINAYLTGMYMLLNEYLSSGQPLYLPPVIVGFDLSAHYYLTLENINEHIKLLSRSQNKDREICVYNSKTIHFSSSSIDKDSNGKPKAIIAVTQNRPLAIRITPPDTVCKFGSVSRYKDYPTIEIDLSDAGDMLQKSRKDDVFNYLMNNRSIYYWLYNSKISKAFPQIIKRSKAYYDSAQARIKKEAEERKAAAALREAEERKQLEEFRKQAEKRSRLRQEQLQQNIADFNRKQEEQEKREAEENALEQEKVRMAKEEYALGLSDVSDKFNQQNSIIRDCFGNRWVKCERCNAIKQDVEFTSYGGTDHINLGTCRECSRKQH